MLDEHVTMGPAPSPSHKFEAHHSAGSKHQPLLQAPAVIMRSSDPILHRRQFNLVSVYEADELALHS